MEFDELKKVWDSQNDTPMYVINQDAMHRIIVQRKNQAVHITNFTELLAIIVNAATGAFMLSTTLAKNPDAIFLYLLSGWMFLTAIYVLLIRIKRMKSHAQFDRSMRGELDFALATATHQVRFSQLMRWNIVPITTFILLGLLENEKSLWIAMATLVFLVVVFYFSGWEHKFYERKKYALETLKKKLEGDAGSLS